MHKNKLKGASSSDSSEEQEDEDYSDEAGGYSQSHR